VGEVTGLIRGTLTVGMVNGCTVTPLFDGLAAFRQAHPGVGISLSEGSSGQLIDAVRAGAIDLALVGTAGTVPAGLGALTIISERLVVAVPPGHPLARQPRVTLRDLDSRPVVCMPPGTGLRTVFDQACAAHGVQPAITLQASAADAIASLASRGLAAGILSESMAVRYQGQLAARLIGDATAPALLALIWRPAPGPAVRALAACCRRAFGEG
jgi:DNA-binding transcriptional LysR family regulator